MHARPHRGQAEVKHFDKTGAFVSRRYIDIGRLHVAMDDVLSMGGAEAFGGLNEN